MFENGVASPFLGFEQPRKNYFRLPNNWFELWAWIRARMEALGLRTNQLGALIKWVEYLLKHSWGYLNFDVPVRLTNDEFQDGRRRATQDGTRGSRMDLGTGLSSRTLVKVPALLLDLGLIERQVDDSDKARVKHWYLPRLHPDRGESQPVFYETLDTFTGFDFPDSDWFPVPFAWTNLTRPIGSAVEILSCEYLMRHTFGWRDPVRWLTATEISSGRQRRDGTTYDAGIYYSRDVVVAACKKLVERKLLVWRPAEREIGREEREYALRLKGMRVDDDTGQWLGSESDDKLGQSKPLIGQSKGADQSKSTALPGQSKPLSGQSKPLEGQSKPLGGQCKPRSDNNTFSQHPSQNLEAIPTTTTPPAADSVDVAALRQALHEAGIIGKKRDEILALDPLPESWQVYGWVYWAFAQEWASHNPIGAAINMLLDPDTRHNPPFPFDQFGLEQGEPASAARALREAYRLAGYDPLPEKGENELARLWRQYYDCYPHQLPLPNQAMPLWPREQRVLRAGLDSPLPPELPEKWQEAWREWLLTLPPSSQERWRDVSKPLGYSEEILVIQVVDLTARVAVEEYRPDLESRMGTEIQFTGIALDLPLSDEEAEQPVPEAERVWAQILTQLELGMTRASFDQNFRPCTPQTLESQCLVIQAPNSAARDWIVHRLQRPLRDAIWRATCDVAQLVFVTPDKDDGIVMDTVVQQPYLEQGEDPIRLLIPGLCAAAAATAG
ncbi:MAG: hypothetical protein JW900_08095 [Anaerolineae bacterium]|nr:hypothetical protein [Anaerolineae bacterium]